MFERIFYLLLAAAGAYVIYAAQGFKATAYPAALGAILCACSLIQLARTFRKRNGGQAEGEKKPQRSDGERTCEREPQAEKAARNKLTREQWAVVWTMLAMLAYLLLLKLLGFILASIAFMAGLMWLHGYRYPWRIAAITLPVSFGLYFFFTRVVHIGLPSGILPF